MYKSRILFVAVLALVGNESKAYTSVAVPQVTSAICSQLGEVAYWAATAHLSSKDKKQLAKAEAAAKAPNNIRPAIPDNLINEARKFGVISHGNAGDGNLKLDDARADTISTAMSVYEMCVSGRLAQ